MKNINIIYLLVKRYCQIAAVNVHTIPLYSIEINSEFLHDAMAKLQKSNWKSYSLYNLKTALMLFWDLFPQTENLYSTNVYRLTLLLTPFCRDGRIPLLTSFKDSLSAKVTLTCFTKEVKFATPFTDNPTLRSTAEVIFHATIWNFWFSAGWYLLRLCSCAFRLGYKLMETNAIYNGDCSIHDVTNSFSVFHFRHSL